jgi:uncharacterized membrane protein
MQQSDNENRLLYVASYNYGRDKYNEHIDEWHACVYNACRAYISMAYCMNIVYWSLAIFAKNSLKNSMALYKIGCKLCIIVYFLET